MTRFKVAHLKLQGTDFVLVPVSSELASMSGADQTQALRQLAQVCRMARLGGEVIPVWTTGPSSLAFLAGPAHHALLSGQLNPSFLKANLNREISTTQVDGPLMRLVGDPSARTMPPAAASGSASPSSPGPTTQPGGGASITSGKNVIERPRRNGPRTGQPGSTRLVTLLFSDIVQSTRLKQDHGDVRGLEIIRKHHDLVRRLLSQSGGGEEISTSGDSFFIAFGTPSAAVRFALQLQATLRQPIDENIRISDRIGIHVGEVFVEEGGPGKEIDLYGIQVDTCARIMALASADQILMSRMVFENARHFLRGQSITGVGTVTWLGHGVFELKGVEDEVELCEAGEAGRACLRTPQDGPAGRRATDAIRPPI